MGGTGHSQGRGSPICQRGLQSKPDLLGSRLPWARDEPSWSRARVHSRGQPWAVAATPQDLAGLGGSLSSYRRQTSGHPWVPFQREPTRGRGRARDPFPPRPPAGPSQTQHLPGDRHAHKSSAFLSMNMPGLVGTRLCRVTQSCPTVQPHGLWPSRLLSPWDSPDKNTGVGCYFLLQGVFLTQGWSPGLSHRRRMLYHLGHQERQTTQPSTEEGSPQSSTQFKPAALPGSAVVFTDREIPEAQTGLRAPRVCVSHWTVWSL